MPIGRHGASAKWLKKRLSRKRKRLASLDKIMPQRPARVRTASSCSTVASGSTLGHVGPELPHISRAGPHCRADLWRWAERAIHAIGAEGFNVAEKNAENGIIMLSDFSGMLCGEIAMETILLELSRLGVDVSRCWCHRACDTSASARRVCTAAPSERLSPNHVFSDIVQQVPKDAQQEIDKIYRRIHVELQVADSRQGQSGAQGIFGSPWTKTC